MIIKCDTCGKKFYKKPSQIRKSRRHYCSFECTRTSVEVACNSCGKMISKQPNQLKNKNYCSRLCFVASQKNGKMKECSFCHKSVYRTDKFLQKNSTGNFFCSNECKSEFFRRNYMVQCVVCAKEFEKPPAEQERYPTHCCSVECRNKYNDKRQTHKCTMCDAIFSRPPSLIDNKKKLFCSSDCHNKFQDTKVTLKCNVCGVSFRISPVYANRTNMHFCSQTCSSKYVVNGKVFEEEFWKLVSPLGLVCDRNDRKVLMNTLPQYFPNKRFALELDFYFPDIAYAVEINGAPHLWPIYGDVALQSRKARDIRKKHICKEAGITLRTIKVDSPYLEDIIPKFKRAVWEIKRRIKCHTNQ